MSSSHNVSKIFWPNSLCKEGLCGYLIGWNVRGFIVCVAGLVSNETLENVELTLAKVLENSSDCAVENMNNVCKVKPEVLGILENGQDNFALTDTADIALKKENANVWMHIEINDLLVPSLKSMYCCGYRYHSLSSEIIFYCPPDPYYLQHISIEPLDLDTTVAEIVKKHYKAKSELTLDEQSESEKAHAEKLKKIHLHTSYSPAARMNRVYELDTILHQINCAQDLNLVMQCAYKPSLRRNSFVNIPVNNNLILQRFYNSFGCLISIFNSIISWPLILIIILLRLFAEVCITFFNMKPKPSWIFNDLPLKDFTATGLQMDLRLQQMCFWPYQWMLFRVKGWRYSIDNRAQYINFYNTMWLIANDIIIGLAIGTFFITNNEIVSEFLFKYVIDYSIEFMKSTIVWLMGWPAGLKLNDQMDRFMGEMFLWLLIVWSYFIDALKGHLPSIIRVLGYSGVFGASMTISMISDLLNILSIHVFVFYSVAARIYNWQLNCLWSLFNLFRGKKYNVLRNRLDSADYTLDQLLLGTILFTLLFFLFPTVVVYYVLFCFARVVVIIMQIILRTLLSFLNHFPLFALMIRIKDSKRLPGGIKISVCPIDYYSKKSLQDYFEFFLSLFGFIKLEHKYKLLSTSAAPSRKSSVASSIGTTRSPFMKMTEFVDPKENHLRQRFTPVSEKSSPVIPKSPNPAQKTTIYLNLENVPIRLSAIFFQYLLLWRRLTTHFVSFYVLKGLILGEPIRPVPLLQYPMLPEKRPDLKSFWIFLKDSFNI